MAIPLAAAAFLCHPSMHVERNYTTRATLDGLAIGTALLLLSWTFVLGSLWGHSDLTTAGGIVALACPFGDIVIIFLFVLKVRSTAAIGCRPLRTKRRPRCRSSRSSLPLRPSCWHLVVITFQMELHHQVDRFAWLTGLGLTCLVIARQALLLNDRRRSSSLQPAMTGSTRRRRAPSPHQRISQRAGDLRRVQPGSGQEGVTGVLEIGLMPMSA